MRCATLDIGGSGSRRDSVREVESLPVTPIYQAGHMLECSHEDQLNTDGV